MLPKDADGMANSVDPDQTASLASCLVQKYKGSLVALSTVMFAPTLVATEWLMFSM